MDVDDILEFAVEGVGPLERPVMLVGLSGWFDVGGAATQAVSAFTDDDRAIIVGSIDPDPFYDFTQERPLVRVDDGLREIAWPRNEFIVRRGRHGGPDQQPRVRRDVVALVGVEPHLFWSTYVDAITTVADTLRCEAIVTVGASAEALPHTRTPPVTGSTANTELARVLGLVAPSYEGVTGIAGVLQSVLEAAGTPAISLRVGIPHYLMNAEHPQATAALVRHLSHVLGVPADIDLSDEIRSWREVHDEVVDSDDQLGMYVRMLEAEFDRRSEAAIPSADDIAEDFENFLRDLRRED